MTGEGGAGSWSRYVVLPDSPLAAGRARRVVADLLALGGCVDAAGADVVVLLASELATNAVRHARAAHAGPRLLWLEARLCAGALRVAVRDPDPTRPTLAEPGPCAESGRGLCLVAGLAKEWGVLVEPDGSGKSVWFACDIDGSAR